MFADITNGLFLISSNNLINILFFFHSCHRTHNKPDITNTLLAVNMYSNFEMQYGLDDEYDFGRFINI